MLGVGAGLQGGEFSGGAFWSIRRDLGLQLPSSRESSTYPYPPPLPPPPPPPPPLPPPPPPPPSHPPPSPPIPNPKLLSLTLSSYP